MTRIIAGAAQRTTLKVPPTGTRPTSDKVREAIFNTLQARKALREAKVLDLYAGSGALGLEALSQGAVEVDLVDLANPAIIALRSNLAAVQKAIVNSYSTVRNRTNAGYKPGLNRSSAQLLPPPPGQVIKQNVDSFLEQWLQAKAQGVTTPGWHLVFLDPPYDLPTVELQKVLDRLHPLIDPDAWVVIERSSRSQPLNADPQQWEVVVEKTYGETWVGYWRPAIVEEAEADSALSTVEPNNQTDSKGQ